MVERQISFLNHHIDLTGIRIIMLEINILQLLEEDGQTLMAVLSRVGC